MNKIKVVSRLLRVGFQLCFFVVPVLLFFYWLNAPKPLEMLSHLIVVNMLPDPHYVPANFPVINYLSPTTKILGFIFSFIPAGFVLVICHYLVKLFRAFENNEIFTISNVKFVRNISYLLLASQLIGQPIYQALLTVALTWNNHPKMIMISFNQSNIGILVVSLLIILIAWIMTEGYKLREDQALTI
jgi:uncharacterized membrane protein